MADESGGRWINGQYWQSYEIERGQRYHAYSGASEEETEIAMEEEVRKLKAKGKIRNDDTRKIKGAEGGKLEREEMASDSSESDENNAGDVENNENKRKHSDSGSSRSVRKREEYLVGMVAESRTDGVFNDQHKIGKFVEKIIGQVRSIRITRSGMVIIECVSKEQRETAVKKIKVIDGGSCVKCFPLGSEVRKKGVVSGVPLSVEEEVFLSVERVFEARRMKRYCDGEREESTSMCLTFDGELPERIYVDYCCYKVRPFERAPLRCYSCQEYGHVAAVCRGIRRCGRCGGEECDRGSCLRGEEEAKCLHCGGNHHAGSKQCPKRDTEIKVNKIRARETNISYAEAVKRVERNDNMEVVGKEPQQQRKESEQNMCVDKKGFLTFMAMVINCAEQVKGKTDKIKMLMDAARRFLNIVDISGEDIEKALRDEFPPTQTDVSGS